MLIMTDQMRGDCMGTAGHPDVKTPNLDHLAACGVIAGLCQRACHGDRILPRHSVLIAHPPMMFLRFIITS